MEKPRKTEVTIGFTMHYPSFVKREMAQMKKADVIFLEAPYRLIRDIRAGKSPEKLFKEGYFSEEKYAKKYATKLKSIIDSGKTVIGYENLGGNKYWKPKEVRRMLDLQDISDLAIETKNHEIFIRAEAEIIKMRDKKNLAWLKANIPRYEGKIYVDAGAVHTHLWHGLKKEFEKDGIPVKAEFLARGKFGNRRIKMKYSPTDRLVRTIRFDTNALGNPDRLYQLMSEDRKFREVQSKLILRRQHSGRPFLRAVEKNTMRILRKR